MLFQEGLELQAQRVILSAAKEPKWTPRMAVLPRVLRCAQEDTLGLGARWTLEKPVQFTV